MADEAIRTREICGREDARSFGVTGVGEAMMHAVRRVAAEPDVPVFGVVPPEEVGVMRARVLERAEARRETRPVLERLQLRLGVRTEGREWVFVTPRSDSSSATGLDVIEEPRSACSVN